MDFGCCVCQQGAFMSGVWPVLSMRGYTLHNKDKVTLSNLEVVISLLLRGTFHDKHISVFFLRLIFAPFYPVIDPGFPKGRRQPQSGSNLLFGIMFVENEKNRFQRGCASLAPLDLSLFIQFFSGLHKYFYPSLE